VWTINNPGYMDGLARGVHHRLIWFPDRSRTRKGTGAEVYGKSLGRRLRISL